MSKVKKDVSILLPTYNEAENLPVLVPKIVAVLAPHKLDFEIIVVDDDSPDQTATVAEAMCGKYPVRVIRRETKPRHLSLAILDGAKASSAKVCVMMDADMSHPVDTLPMMIQPILDNEADITVGSRNIMGGGVEGWPLHRRFVSRFAGLLGRGLTSLTDPTTGFMGVRRELLLDPELNPLSWKIVLEVVTKNPGAVVKEVPIMFKDRLHGESKMGVRAQIDYLAHLMVLYCRKFRSKDKS